MKVRLAGLSMLGARPAAIAGDAASTGLAPAKSALHVGPPGGTIPPLQRPDPYGDTWPGETMRSTMP